MQNSTVAKIRFFICPPYSLPIVRWLTPNSLAISEWLSPASRLLLASSIWNELSFSFLPNFTPVCTENLIRVDDVMESHKLAE
jgi:hypothetical protein